MYETGTTCEITSEDEDAVQRDGYTLTMEKPETVTTAKDGRHTLTVKNTYTQAASPTPTPSVSPSFSPSAGPSASPSSSEPTRIIVPMPAGLPGPTASPTATGTVKPPPVKPGLPKSGR